MTRRALMSVSDKNGLVDFAHGLSDLGWELIASGGTAATLRAAEVPVQTVEAVTGSPEILGGRVKTLHPAIHGGILARNSQADANELAEHGWSSIDLVAVNLYPFQTTVARPGASLEEAIENIDIGGVALLRAAAKNFSRVTVLSDPADYPSALAELQANGEVSPATRRRLALKAFVHTAAYDSAICDYLAAEPTATPPERLVLNLYQAQSLRYGENPHQAAVLFGYRRGEGPLGGEVLQGKALSYNNLLDLDAAWRAVVSFDNPTVAIVKHLSPCGIASAPDQSAAFAAALASDPVSAYGGVIAANRPFTGALAEALGDLFVEAIAAPGFEAEACERLARRKNCRLVSMPDLEIQPDYELRTVNRGMLWQTIDRGDQAEWTIVTDRAPTAEESRALAFAWRACQHVKSNAIVLAQGTATVGIGGGQPNRVDCVRIAAERAGERARGSVLASDAYFPFPDGIEEAAKAGVTAIVQPGGSIRDNQAIAAANQAAMAMAFTGVRHFRH